MIASVYVPNGGKDFDAKMRFLQALESYVADAERDGKLLIVCGDLNVALEERDIHPKLRKPGLIGATPEERALLGRLISHASSTSTACSNATTTTCSPGGRRGET
jgi:exodeoxyribonuclease-3